MRKKYLVTLGVVGVVLLLGLWVYSRATFTVAEQEYVLLTRFGEIHRIEDRPGKHYKAPFIDDVVERLDGSVQTIDLVPEPLSDHEGRRAVFTLTVRYQLADLQRFRKTVIDHRQARGRLGDLTVDFLRGEISRLDYAVLIDADGSFRQPAVRELEARVLSFLRGIPEQQGSWGLEILEFKILEITLRS